MKVDDTWEAFWEWVDDDDGLTWFDIGEMAKDYSKQEAVKTLCRQSIISAEHYSFCEEELNQCEECGEYFNDPNDLDCDFNCKDCALELEEREKSAANISDVFHDQANDDALTEKTAEAEAPAATNQTQSP
jgi:hypothetical protein